MRRRQTPAPWNPNGRGASRAARELNRKSCFRDIIMATVKKKEECSRILKKFAPPVTKPKEGPLIEDHGASAVNVDDSTAIGEAPSLVRMSGIVSATQEKESTREGAKDRNKKKRGISDSGKQLKKKKEELVKAAKSLLRGAKENIEEAKDGEDSHQIQTAKEQCHLTDSQYEELFQRVLQKSVQDCLDDSEKNLQPPQITEEQDTRSETFTLSPVQGDSILPAVLVESDTAKETSLEVTQKQLGSVAPKPSKLSLKKRRKGKAESAKENKAGRKRTRKGQPKKIVEGYTLITDQDDMEEGERPLNQCVAWVQCCKMSCEKWRRLDSGVDPSSLPDSWSCSQNTDFKFNNCNIPEETWSGSDEEVIYATFVPGSIVWAKQYGYPWWPGMVEADPDIGVYFLFTSNLDQLPSKYHITFFGDSASRAWICASMLKNFQEMNVENLDLKKGKNKDYIKRYEAGIKMAAEAEKMNIQDRLAKFGFWSRYRHDELEQDGVGGGESDDPTNRVSEGGDGSQKYNPTSTNTVPGVRQSNPAKKVKKKIAKKVFQNEKRDSAQKKIRKCEPKSHVANESAATTPEQVENIKENQDTTSASKSVCEIAKSGHVPKKIRKCEPKSHVANAFLATKPRKAEGVKEKDNTPHSKPGKTSSVCEIVKSGHVPKKIRKCEPEGCVRNEFMATTSENAEKVQEKEHDASHSKPGTVCHNEKRHSAPKKIRKDEPKSQMPNESVATNPKKAENVKEKEVDTLPSESVCEIVKTGHVPKKIRKCELKSHVVNESVVTTPQKTEKDKEKKNDTLHSKPGGKKKFTLPKSKTICPKPSPPPMGAKEDALCTSNDIQPSIDPGKCTMKLKTCFEATHVAKTKGQAAHKVAALVDEEDSFSDWLEEVKANEKELEEALSDDMLNILMEKQTELQEDFSIVLSEDSHEP